MQSRFCRSPRLTRAIVLICSLYSALSSWLDDDVLKFGFGQSKCEPFGSLSKTDMLCLIHLLRNQTLLYNFHCPVIECLGARLVMFFFYRKRWSVIIYCNCEISHSFWALPQVPWRLHITVLYFSDSNIGEHIWRRVDETQTVLRQWTRWRFPK